MKLTGTHHVAILTQNFAELEEFYTQTLGFPVTKRWDDVTIVFIGIGSTTIELIGREHAPAKDSRAGAIDHIALHVADVDAAYQELVDKNVRIKSPPTSFKEIRICFFYDPDGNLLELVEDPRAAGK